MPSPIFKIGQCSTLGGTYVYGSYDTALEITPNYYVKIALQSSAGVNSIGVTLSTADTTTLTAGLPTVTVDQATKTATFQMPNRLGCSINIKVVINSGVDSNGGTQPSYTKVVQAYTTLLNGMVQVVVDEVDEYSRAYGHTDKIGNVVGCSPSTDVFWAKGIVTTTSGTPSKTCVTIPAPSASTAVYQLQGHVCARDLISGDCAGYTIYRAAKWQSGAWTLLGASATVSAHEDDATWDVTFAVSSTNIVLTVTGDATNNTSWLGAVQITKL